MGGKRQLLAREEGQRLPLDARSGGPDGRRAKE